MFFHLVVLAASLTTMLLASPVIPAARSVVTLPRLVQYFQTTHDSRGKPISMLPLVHEKGIALTHFIVCSFHLNKNGQIYLNDHRPGDPIFYTLWNETRVMKSDGVKVMGMIGGALPGWFSSDALDGDKATFDKHYSRLRDVICQFNLEGLDIDVEQTMSQAGIERLVDKLHCDFGAGFIISLAPVASALKDGTNLSGFDYKLLESRKGSKIHFYNTQFYNGFGEMSSTDDYNEIVANGFEPARIVAGQLTYNNSGDDLYCRLNATVASLRDKYDQLGGIAGWEYFDGQAANQTSPWKWAQDMTRILQPDSRLERKSPLLYD